MASLHTALDTMRYQQFSLLLERGADVNLRDEMDRTPLMKCCQVSDTKQAITCCRSLLRKGADKTLCDSRGCNALIIAARTGRLRLVKEFLKHADIDLRTADKDGNNALHHAVSQGHVDITQCISLHAKEKNVSLDVGNAMGFTPLLLACRDGHLEIARLLVNEHRASQTVKDNVYFRCVRDWLSTHYELSTTINPFDEDEVLKPRKHKTSYKRCQSAVEPITRRIEGLTINYRERIHTAGNKSNCSTEQKPYHNDKKTPGKPNAVLKGISPRIPTLKQHSTRTPTTGTSTQFYHLFDIYSEQQTHAYRTPASSTQDDDKQPSALGVFRDAVGRINALDKVVRIMSSKNTTHKNGRRASLKAESTTSSSRNSKRSLSTSSLDSDGSTAAGRGVRGGRSKRLLKRRSTSRMRLTVPEISLDEVFK